MGYKTVPMDMALYSREHLFLTGELTAHMHTQPVSAFMYTNKKEKK